MLMEDLKPIRRVINVKKVKKIVVAGDVAIDWLQWYVKPKEDRKVDDSPAPPNWALYPCLRMVARPGGALLLAHMVKAATGAAIISHNLENIENIAPETVIHSITQLGEFPYSNDVKDEKNMVYRVKQFCGYSGPIEGIPRSVPIIEDAPNAEIVLLDDAGNKFRDEEAVWPRALQTEDRKPIVVLKMSRPLATGKLWELVRKNHADRLVVVISANDLRECGVNISRRLSWERTAQDFIWQMANNRAVRSLADCANLVVRFGIDGTILYTRREGQVRSTLYYDPNVAEDDYKDIYPGDMQGLMCAFVAALTARLTKEGLEAVGEGVRDGVKSSRRLFQHGFGKPPSQPDYPGKETFEPTTKESFIANVPIPNAVAHGYGQQGFWTILEDMTRARLEGVAYNMVVKGTDSLLRYVPIGSFGALKTVDRVEIESYQSIRNLMREYLDTKEPKSPLSIAVFGPPGSGKSFGVTELAKSIAPGKVEKLEFNVAQFESTADLVSALHKVRDLVLQSKIPLVFFDEFDSLFGSKLGWLKYFLAPMQDGMFKDGETMHPIGKSIFVFAGGTSHTFQEFCGEDLHENDKKQLQQEFRTAKGTDFVSRLRGYVNIMGPNPSSKEDKFFMIRRAILLRSILQKNAKHIFDARGQARIDPGVLRALIKVPEYKHGVRSIVAIIEMSMLADRRRFEQAALPPEEQLKLHVGADIFSRLVLRDVLFGDALENLARTIHEKYREEQKGKKPKDDHTMVPWGDLAEEYKESNRQQANQIPEKLQRIGYGFAPSAGKPTAIYKFSDEEVEILARVEHERWMTEKIQAGWKFGPKRDEKNKTNPALVPWAKLPKKEKVKDYHTVRLIPELLATAGFEIYPLQ
jgi:hypothetical protein